MLSVLSKLKSILWHLKIEREIRIFLKKDTKQYRKRSLYVLSFANIISKNVRFLIYVPRMTESNSLSLYLRNSATVLIFWLNDMVYCALLIIGLPILYQTKNCGTKVTQFFVGYENFVEWKFVQYCFVLAQLNSHKIMAFVRKKALKISWGDKNIWKRRHICKTTSNFTKFNTTLPWIKKVFLNYTKKKNNKQRKLT